jgi:hypothetical protein
MSGFWAMVKGTFSMYKDKHALKLLNESAPHGSATLVQIAKPEHALEETNA